MIEIIVNSRSKKSLNELKKNKASFKRKEVALQSVENL